tara:strand:+ start:64 stop:348 length:285 start_codon:yes stop_codon:yes gene_type:complete
MNGKGDKWRGGWSQSYANNHKKIFGGNMIKDIKGSILKINDRVCIQEDIPSIDGMLYKNTICKVDSLNESKVRVQDRSGKLWWVAGNQVSASFL